MYLLPAAVQPQALAHLPPSEPRPLVHAHVCITHTPDCQGCEQLTKLGH